MSKQPSAGSTKRILVIDDDPDICDLLSRILKKGGNQVDVASSAEAALRLFPKREYKLITLDYAMPEINGKEFHQILSNVFGYGKRTSSVHQRLPPILLITGHEVEVVMEGLMFKEQVVGILRKPVDPKELLNVVENLAS